MLQPVEEAGWCQGGGGWGVTGSGGGRMVSGWGRLGCYSKWGRQDDVSVGKIGLLQPVQEAGWCQGEGGWGDTTSGGGRMMSGWERYGYCKQWNR